MAAAGKCEQCKKNKKEIVSGLCWTCKVNGVGVKPIANRKRIG